MSADDLGAEISEGILRALRAAPANTPWTDEPLGPVKRAFEDFLASLSDDELRRRFGLDRVS